MRPPERETTDERTADEPTPGPRTDGTIDRTTPCRQCGYDPRGEGWIVVDGQDGFQPSLASLECPECDAIVAFRAALGWDG